MDIVFFKTNLAPLMEEYNISYSYFPNGDLGNLERVEFEGEKKIGTIDFWSSGWLGIDVFDLALDDQVMNVLLNSEEEFKKREAMNILKSMLIK